MTNNNICLNACWEKVIKSHTLGNKLLIAEIGREWLPAQLARGIMRVTVIVREAACPHGSGGGWLINECCPKNGNKIHY